MIEHEFTPQIVEKLRARFGDNGTAIFERSPLLQYLNIKTVSATRGSKSRGSFANIYAVFVLIEDYLNKGYVENGIYADYDGARFTDIFRRQRQLPFGSKLQNHALNSRMNEEFKKFFPEVEYVPILRNVQTNRYWINDNLLKIHIQGSVFNIAPAVMDIINAYVDTKRSAFVRFIETCEMLKGIVAENDERILQFITGLLAPNVDARIFEIVSYAILKFYYREQIVYIGFDLEEIQEEYLRLYKTGRTNANDGGIDFVMRPLGRFFQVTESLDVKKYFLDIDKIERYPISFVIKSEADVQNLLTKLRENAQRIFSINAIVDRYMSCVEEIINIPILIERFNKSVSDGYLREILDEIILQSKVEFNIDDTASEHEPG